MNGTVGLVLAPRGRLWRALRLAVRNGRIVEVDVVADPTRLQELEIAVLNG